ncbi:hypothetical protein LAZ67_14001351 [Cordylochernes scorpioides]|uniref:Reverse transcriptase domain-containing protein n=1 Tax=Cordylochernes scorpioides TaxID=51811 RepID=A0ABY6L601_9ARAC|nr:hypothetical protein LAZ67_14001351 [Cordylochernes scorpioides]
MLRLKNVSQPRGLTMSTFDVTSLFLCLPHSLIIDGLEQLLSSSTLPSNNQKTILDLFTICLNMNALEFNGCFFVQMRGSPMGSPLSTIAAEIVMSNLDRWLVSHNHLGIEMWSRIKRQYKLDSKTFEAFKATNQNLPNLYGLPKIHKANTPLRPIISYSGSPLYPIAKYLSSIISPFQKKLPYTVPNPVAAIETINNIPIPHDSYMVSFDIESLYTSIPHDEAILALQEFLHNHPEIILPIPKEALIDLIELYRYFKQVKGLPMGNSVSSALANIYMDKIDKIIADTAQLQVIIWKRYIDDILCITKVDLSTILNFLNNLKPFLKFTFEIEENNSLPFLDIQLTRNQDRIETRIYRKPTHTGSYLNFNSFGPIHHKISVVKTLSKRLITHFSTNNNDTKKERTKVFQELLSNNYPKPFIKKHFYRPRISTTNNRQTSSQNIFCSLPYSYGCERIARKLKYYNITTRFQSISNLNNILRHPDTKKITEPNNRTNVIYKIPCKSCQAVYIGETGKPLTERINQHKSVLKHHNPTSLLVDHALINGHIPDFEQTSIIYQDIKEKHSRLFLESWSSLEDRNSIN